MKSTLYAICTCLILTGCDQIETIKKEFKGQQNSTQDVTKKLTEALNEAKGVADKLGISKTDTAALGNMAKNEVDKLFTVEYKVFEVDAVGGPAAIDATLNKAGQDRWDCFSVDHVESTHKYRFFCKRQPKSYLRALGTLPKL